MSALHSALHDVPASAIMTGPVKTAYARWPVTRLIEFFIENGITGAPVIASDGAMVGVVSISDVLRAARSDGTPERKLSLAGYLDNSGMGYELGKEQLATLLRASVTDFCVSDIMTRAVLYVDAEAPLLQALRLMHEKRIHRVFVVSRGRLVGVISNSSLLAGLVGQQESIAA